MDARENLPEDLAACRDANLVGEDKARLLETLVDSRTPSNAANLEMAAALYEEALDRCIKSSGAKNPR